MSLSRDELRRLDQIEQGLQDDDPAFAVTLTFAAAVRHQQRRVGQAHWCLCLGVLMLLTGRGLGLVSLGAGVIVALYGFGVTITAMLALLHYRGHRPHPHYPHGTASTRYRRPW
jgi:Protein of unknown function (DUF3040)